MHLQTVDAFEFRKCVRQTAQHEIGTQLGMYAEIVVFRLQGQKLGAQTAGNAARECWRTEGALCG